MRLLQEKLNKLYSMKQELQNTFRQFENMGHTDQLENREDSVECSLSQFTEQVNSELNTCINQVRYVRSVYVDKLKVFIKTVTQIRSC